MAGRTTTNNLGRGGSMYSLNPHKELRIIGLDTKDGPEHPNYDKRAFLDIEEPFIAGVAMFGVLEPVIGRRNGNIVEVIAGRQRTKAARVVNERRAGKVPIPENIPQEWKDLYAKGLPQLFVPTILRRSDEREQQQIQIIENEGRVGETPTTRAFKMKKLEDSGHNIAMIAAMFNITPDGVKKAMRILDASSNAQKACEEGFISASALAEMIDLPHEEQDRRIAEAKALGVTISTSTARKEGIGRRSNGATGPKPPGREVLRKLIKHEKFSSELNRDARSLLCWIATGDDGHIERVAGLKRTLRELGVLPNDADAE